jgi:hypothetical protein
MHTDTTCGGAVTTYIPRLDITTVRDLAHPLDPVASVYLGLTPTVPTLDTGEDLELRWRSLSKDLTEQGADQPTIDAIGQQLAGLPVFPTELALFAAGGAVRLAQPIPGGVRFDRARFAAPPDVVPLLAWLQRHPPYVVAVIDRTGADVSAVPGGAVSGLTTVIAGPDDEIERNAPGGWAQPRYQRRAEDSWQHNAAAVADAVTRALHDLHARLLLVAGDVRAVQLLHEHLPAQIRRDVTLRHLPGGRSPDGSTGARQEAIVEAVTEHAADTTIELLDHFTERDPAATVEGAAATLTALAAGRVATLFVADEPDDTRMAWYGTHVLGAAAAHDVPDGTGRWRARGRLVDIAVRAALLTDADVRVLDIAAGRFTDDIGALCRYSAH